MRVNRNPKFPHGCPGEACVICAWIRDRPWRIRHQEKETMMTTGPDETYYVLVPKPGTHAWLHIDAGSGVVTANWQEVGPLTVYFEGNRFGSDNLTTLAERIKCAAGRLHRRYPTIARGVFPASEFAPVGTLVFASDWSTAVVTITDEELVTQWAGPAKKGDA
jgi:hypothetical protein